MSEPELSGQEAPPSFVKQHLVFFFSFLKTIALICRFDFSTFFLNNIYQKLWDVASLLRNFQTGCGQILKEVHWFSAVVGREGGAQQQNQMPSDSSFTVVEFIPISPLTNVSSEVESVVQAAVLISHAAAGSFEYKLYFHASFNSKVRAACRLICYIKSFPCIKSSQKQKLCRYKQYLFLPSLDLYTYKYVHKYV